MIIIVNGQEVEVSNNIETLAELVEHYQLKAEYVVAEVDGEVLERTEWATYEVKPGVRIELVHFVGGG